MPLHFTIPDIDKVETPEEQEHFVKSLLTAIDMKIPDAFVSVLVTERHDADKKADKPGPMAHRCWTNVMPSVAAVLMTDYLIQLNNVESDIRIDEALSTLTH